MDSISTNCLPCVSRTAQMELTVAGSSTHFCWPSTAVQGLSRLCVQRVIWTHRTLFFDSLDTQILLSEFADDDFS